MIQIKDSLGIDTRPLDKNRDRPAASGKAKSSGGGEAVPSQDKVVLSGKSKDALRAQEALANTPVTRQEKIDAIKEQIANNEYQVSSEKVAQRMIVDFLREMA